MGKRRHAVVYAVALEEVGPEKRHVLVADLVSPSGHAWPKRVVLNKTNSLQLAAAFGDDAAGWTGCTLEIWAENVPYQGRLVPGIKVLPTRPAASAAVAPTPRPVAGNGAAAPVTVAPAVPPAPVAAPVPPMDDVPGGAPIIDDDIPI